MDTRLNKEYAIKKIKDLAELLEKNSIKIDQLFLFGSFLNDNKDLSWSDIDLAIVSENFSGDRFDDNKRLIPFVVKIEPRIETHPYTPENFLASPFVKDEILKKSLKLIL